VVEAMSSCGFNYVVSNDVNSTTEEHKKKDTKSLMNGNQHELILEPNIKELLTFVIPKVLKVPFSEYYKGKNDVDSIEDRAILNRHPIIHEEVKKSISRELKLMSIKVRKNYF
jgi:hypothetical protein